MTKASNTTTNLIRKDLSKVLKYRDSASSPQAHKAYSRLTEVLVKWISSLEK